MEVLYPLPSLSSFETEVDSGVTVLVNHVIDADQSAAFLDALNTLLTAFHAAPGAAGCQVFRHEDGPRVRITILQRFDSAADHEAWLESAEFARWKQAVTPLRPTLEAVRSYSGVGALFAAGAPDAPPRWKMTVVLFIAVFPLSLALSHWFGKALASTPPLLGALISSPIMVVLMTYVMVPILTKIFQAWLQPAKR